MRSSGMLTRGPSVLSQTERPRTGAALGLTLTLAALLPIMLFTSIQDSTLSTASTASLIVVVVSAGALGVCYFRGDVRLMQLGFWLYVYLFLGLAPFTQLTTGVFPLAGDLARPYFFQAAFIVQVGIVAWWLGYRMPYTQHQRVRHLRTRGIIVYSSLSLAAATLYAATVGFARLFSSRIEKSAANSEQFGSTALSALFEAIGTVPIVISVFALLALRRRRKAHGFLLVACALAAIIVNNPYTSSRSWLGSILLALLFSFGVDGNTKRRFRLLVVSWLAGFLIVFPQADVFRYEEAQSFAVVSPQESLVAGDFDSYVQVARGAQLVKARGTYDGVQAVGTLLFYVPRQVWTEKPNGTGAVLAVFAGSSFTNLSAPLWVEGFVDFGWLGTFVYLFGWGIVGRRLDGRLEAESVASDYGIWTVTVPLLAFWQVVLLRGSLLAVVPVFLLIVGSIFALSRPASERAAAVAH